MSRLAIADLLLRDPAALIIVKATVVLTLAGAAAAAARGSSAARRHMIWFAALASCVWLVLSSPVVPAIVVHSPLLARDAGTTVHPTGSPSEVVLHPPRVSAHFQPAQIVRHSSDRSIPRPSHPLVALWILGCVALVLRHAIGFAGATSIDRFAQETL